MKQIKAIKHGKGIQYLLSEVYKILGNPILIHDMEYKIIDINKNVITDDPIWNEYATKGTVDYKWLDFFKNECFIEEAANTKKITFLLSDKLNYDRIFCKIFNKNNIQIGCAVLIACNQPFDNDIPIIFEAVCNIISKELGENEFYNDYGQAYFEKLLKELIAGVDDKALYIAHVESIYMHLKSNLYLAVIDPPKDNSNSFPLAYYRDLLKKAQPEYMYAIYSNYILIIIGTDNQTLDVDKDLSKLNQILLENNMYAGISHSFENLFELNKHYKEALDTLNNNLNKDTNQRIFLELKTRL